MEIKSYFQIHCHVIIDGKVFETLTFNLYPAETESDQPLPRS